MNSTTTIKSKCALTATLVYFHFRKWWFVWVLSLSAVYVFNLFYMIGFNISPSLPAKAFIVERNSTPLKGDYISFIWTGDRYYRAGSKWVKIVAGVEGDVVTRQGRAFYVNGKYVATAKEYSLTNEKLQLGPVGVIGKGEFFVIGVHKDSLDSRYQNAGWIKQENVIGKAYAIF